MITVIAFVVTLGILITIHEYGHFQVARWCGVKVLRFSLGFGTPLLTRNIGKDNTEFVLAAFPLGGYVKMLDEREAPVAEHELHRAFNRQAVWKRMLIVLAGPVANLLLAILLYWVLFMHGVMGIKPLLGDIPSETPAAIAQMKSGELITGIAGETVASWQDVRWILMRQALGDSPVSVEGRLNDVSLHHQLNLSVLDKDDFEGDFLPKLGLVPYRPSMPPMVGEVVAGSAAEKAGLRAGDNIRAIDGVAITAWDQVVDTIRLHPHTPLKVTVARDAQTVDLQVIPDSVRENGKDIGRIGAAYKANQSELDKIMTTVSYSPGVAAAKAVTKTWETSVFSLQMLGGMLTGDVSWRGMSGPVTIASYAGQSAKIGWEAFLGFLALVSISLGVLNLLPIPVLDGGHLLYYIVEVFKGSPVSERVMEIGQRIGLALLGLLMACAFYNDINRLITG
ncbi:RIP metalloprotease RseP [Methylovorus glucosotrophus]|uniref:Zinc metalloprotease n=1 Tax=Methylovorus glucosotrophus (strain SIP3-4) TaxID=582744 RepID=C6XDM4_METGS|nr:RIP metalloprotease RseP [Methylovorus glucosotrophus]ACT50649.1 membrane-associated zinc metalloprotease [Methylovorus glucosotrophus SIP3-4]